MLEKGSFMSLILAKILGLYFLAIGLAFMISPERFKRLYPQIAKDENFTLLGGIIALFIGATIISIHNEWVLRWPLIITLLGWWSLIKGFTLLIYPQSMKWFSFIQNQSKNTYRVISFFYIILGSFLLYKAWF